MSESDRWMNAIEHLKSAFKDESTISNIAQANLNVVEDVADDDGDDNSESTGQPCCSIGIESSADDDDGNEDGNDDGNDKDNKYNKLETTNKTTGSNDNKNDIIEKNSFVNIDEEYSYHSNDLPDIDRYSPDYIHSMSQDDDDLTLSRILDVSHISQDNDHAHQQSGGNLNISVSQEEEMRAMLRTQQQYGEHDHVMMLDGDDDLSDSCYTGGTTTTDGGSLLLNLWNEDYEGNPDPNVMKKLIEAKRLPRKLDPYIVNQVERAKIIQQLEEYEDDDSSKGSCNVLCSQFFIPTQVAEDDDYTDDDIDSDDSIVDTVINFNTEDNEMVDLAPSASGEATMALDITDLNHKRPKQEKRMYAIPKDSEYRPGIAKNELVLMLPKKNSEDESEDEIPDFSHLLPVQYARAEDSTDRRSKVTYREKEMEFTLQKYDNTPNRIAELVVQGKKSAAASDIQSPCSELSSPGTFESEVELDQLAFRERRGTDDDDPIEEDRSVLTPEEIEAIQRAEAEYEKEQAQEAIAARQLADSKQRGALSQLICILNNKQSCAMNNASYSCMDSLPNKKGFEDGNETVIEKKQVPTDNDKVLFEIENQACKENIHQNSTSNGRMNPCEEEEDDDDDDDEEEEEAADMYDGSVHAIKLANMYDGSDGSEHALKSEDSDSIKKEEVKESDENKHVGDGFLQDRIPFVASSTSADSAMLNPVEGSRLNQVEDVKEAALSGDENSGFIQVKEDDNANLQPKEETNEKNKSSVNVNGAIGIGSNEDENKCPNKFQPQDEEIKACPAEEEEVDQPVSDEFSSIGMEDRGVLLTIGEQKTPSVTETRIIEPRKFATRSCCAVTRYPSSEDNDPNFEELVRLVDAIPTLSSESTGLGEAEEVVMGVPVQGLSCRSPSGEFGVIIHPEMIEKAKKMQAMISEDLIIEDDDEQPESENANISQSSEYYANMILDVTNVVDESMTQNDYITEEEAKPTVEKCTSPRAEQVIEENQTDYLTIYEGKESEIESGKETASESPCTENPVEEELDKEKVLNSNDSVCRAEITTDLSNIDQYYKIKSEVSIPDISFGEMNIEVTDTSIMQSVPKDITEAKTDFASNIQVEDLPTSHLNEMDVPTPIHGNMSLTEIKGVISPSSLKVATIKDDLNKLKESMKKNSSKLGKGEPESSSLFGFSSVNALWN